MKCLIVGCGYLGVALGAALVQRGHEVWGMRRTTEADALLAGVGIRPVHADVTQPGWWRHLPQGVDWAIYCAAPGDGQWASYCSVYGSGVRQAIVELGRLGVRKVVYASSTGVYGQSAGEWVTEESPTEPPDEKGRLLLAAETAWLETAGADWESVTVLRISGMYGAGRGYYLRRFWEGPGLGPGEKDRWVNQVHRDDVVGAVICALERAVGLAVYNVTDDEPVPLGQIFAWLEARTGRLAPAPSTEDAPRRHRPAGNKRVANARLKTELGWRLQYPTFREGYERELMRLGVLKGPDTPKPA